MKTLIVVLNWNSGEMSRKCVESLLAMKEDSSDILIIDNGSQDGSVKYLRSVLPKIEVIANGRNLGFAAGCNIGLRRAMQESADFVLLVNNDTIVDTKLLAELLAEAERTPNAGMVSPKIYYFDTPNRIWWAGGSFSCWLGIPRHIGWKQKEDCQYEKARAIDWATGCALLLRCAALRETGLFDERLFGNGEDLDLSLRMRKLGWQIRYAPAAKLRHKEGFDYRKNVGEHVRKFTATRNILWIMHKHARSVQWFSFWPYFLVRYLFVIVLTSVCRADLKSAKAALAGVGDFFRMRAEPDSMVLPDELLRVMQTAATVREGATDEKQCDGLSPCDVQRVSNSRL